MATRQNIDEETPWFYRHNESFELHVGSIRLPTLEIGCFSPPQECQKYQARNMPSLVASQWKV